MSRTLTRFGVLLATVALLSTSWSVTIDRRA
ncbi:hypothetical protein J2S66_000959 [Saccharothrix longispora]|uniref:Uncharacterized protein n=1 Tax=Saccharothrix longispora TaxID=33920 RepID=A0ABU1PPL6_9PSEU|nr:hypothetical protein [Saccharothrix longispora]